MAAEAVRKPARRTQVFLWPAAEEQGLLGSAAYVANPVVPLAKTAADLNLDSLNFVGAAKDIGVQGSERTELGAMAAATAKAMGLTVAPAKPDLAGGYFRSDHFSFAKAGVPAFSVGAGGSWVKDVEANNAKRQAYRARYHQANDEYDPSWDLSGMVEDISALFTVGRDIADSGDWPEWYDGNEFKAIREASLAEAEE